MARKLKTFLTTSGFFETAVAAPSMKAALDIWGNKTNLFQQGFAKETDDPEIVKAAMAHPGVVLRRPVGSKGAFKEDAELPKLSALEKAAPPKPKAAAAKKQKPAQEKERKKPEPNTAHRKAAELYDLAQKRREKEEQREQEKRDKERERRKQAVDKARAALDAARERHEERLSEIQSEREKIDRKLRLERERWDDEKDKLEAAIKRAGE